jgi:hypothetical protein
MTGKSSRLRLALVVSRFNPEITEGLVRGAQAYLAEQGLSVAEDDMFEAPGAFELPLIAQTLARTGLYQGIMCLGCVIKGPFRVHQPGDEPWPDAGWARLGNADQLWRPDDVHGRAGPRAQPR